ncbi:MAG: hypothetical protein EPN77_19380 [Candidimonas sp.]|nr:MAG: hypothetical protein EPN77_19380 [Candidimonas sp.]
MNQQFSGSTLSAQAANGHRNARVSTPWGFVQTVDTIAPEILKVTTASHGGILVGSQKNLLIPAYMRDEDGAYEEDIEWAVPAIVFENEWRSWALASGRINPDALMESAWQTVRNSLPAAYEKFTGKKLAQGDSLALDEQVLRDKCHHQYCVRTAWGSWHQSVPDGMVGVAGYRASDGTTKYFLVPKDEYRAGANFVHGKASCFVVIPGRHQEIPPIV